MVNFKSACNITHVIHKTKFVIVLVPLTEIRPQVFFLNMFHSPQVPYSLIDEASAKQ